MRETKHNTSDTADREIVVSRVFDAPRELVFDVFTDPKHKTYWWGPRGFTTTTLVHELKPGGIWRHVMHGPDGHDYPNLTKYLEVVRPERLVYEHRGDDEGDVVHFLATVTFEDLGGKTRLTMRSLFPSKAARDHVVEVYGALEGAHDTLARLGELLASLPNADREVVSTRMFDAPRERVFDAFSNPQHLAQWWGPSGFTNTIEKFDLRPGGQWHLVMHGPDGTDYRNQSEFVEVVRPERIVFQHLEPVHRFRMTMTLADRGGKTELTWRMLFDSADELAKLREFIVAANEQNFDRLQKQLASM